MMQSDNHQPDGHTPDQESGAMPDTTSQDSQPFYTVEGSIQEEDLPFAMETAAPFQISGGLPVVGSGTPSAPLPATPARRPRRGRSFYLLIALATIAGLLVLGLALAALVPPAATRAITQARASAGSTLAAQPTKKRTLVETPTPARSASWVPQQLPNGWTASGLGLSDAMFALRTAVTFTDREEALDYRNVGTRGNHGGTLTAALFILTPAGQARFEQNDVRVINNALFDRVEQEQLVQAAIILSPALTQFQAVGQQQFAWVSVPFYLWQSRIDPTTGQRIQGLDSDPATNQPRVHHMVVLLLRVPYNAQGTNPAMGGSGWLVSTYALDSGTPSLLQPA